MFPGLIFWLVLTSVAPVHPGWSVPVPYRSSGILKFTSDLSTIYAPASEQLGGWEVTSQMVTGLPFIS